MDAHKGNELCQTSTRHGQREREEDKERAEAAAVGRRSLWREAIQILANESFMCGKYMNYGRGIGSGLP